MQQRPKLHLLEQAITNLSLSIKLKIMNKTTIILSLAIRQSPHLLPLIMAYYLYKAHQNEPNQLTKLVIAKKLMNLITR